MAKGNKIVVVGNGRQFEGKVEGTPKPGTVMQIKAATEPVANKYTLQAYNRDADGDHPQGPFLVLMENFRGSDATTAYVASEQCRAWIPAPGDELNMLVANIAGTADSFAIGDILMVDDSTGKLVATTGSPETESFMVMETVSAITVDTLIHCIYTGY